MKYLIYPLLALEKKKNKQLDWHNLFLIGAVAAFISLLPSK